MKLNKAILTLAICSLASAAAMAQNTSATAQDIQRNTNQQERIEQGLQSGPLTTREAGRLERQETSVEKMENRAMHDGTVSAAEQRRINRAQNQVSQDIYRQKHDAQVGNPNSPSSRLMQADVQRNANQQARIEQGVQSGQLTNRETARLERNQAHITRTEARQASDGNISAGEVAHTQRMENRASRRIFRQKHD